MNSATLKQEKVRVYRMLTPARKHRHAEDRLPSAKGFEEPWFFPLADMHTPYFRIFILFLSQKLSARRARGFLAMCNRALWISNL